MWSAAIAIVIMNILPVILTLLLYSPIIIAIAFIGYNIYIGANDEN